MKLDKFDIVFIAELRSMKIQWKWIGRIYGMYKDTIRRIFYKAMAKGFK
jgi:hypothetical protein